MSKSNLRRKYLGIRNDITDKENLSELACKKLLNSYFYKKANTVAVFLSFGSEIDTELIVNTSLKLNKILCVPVCNDVDNTIKFYKLNSNTLLKLNKYGIKEPVVSDCDEINPSKIDLVIVPGVCFDLLGNRIGYGGGYYDRFLQSYNGKTVGFCFEQQIYKQKDFPKESTDISLDLICTPQNIYFVKNKKAN